MDKEKYNDFLRNLTLKSIELIESNIKKDKKFNPPASIDIDYKNRTSLNKKISQFAVDFVFDLNSHKNDNKDIKLKIFAEYIVFYSVNKDFFNKEFVEFFSKYNAIIHVWPYFREFVQNMTSRMGIPLLTLDLIAPPPKKERKITNSKKKTK